REPPAKQPASKCGNDGQGCDKNTDVLADAVEFDPCAFDNKDNHKKQQRQIFVKRLPRRERTTNRSAKSIPKATAVVHTNFIERLAGAHGRSLRIVAGCGVPREPSEK